MAEKWLREQFNISIIACVSAVGPIEADHQQCISVTSRKQVPIPSPIPITIPTTIAITNSFCAYFEKVDSNAIRCPDVEAATKMIELVEATRDRHDSVGGVITCVCRNVPVGLGEPCFDKVFRMRWGWGWGWRWGW